MENRNRSVKEYIPVSCDFIDDIEIIATSRKQVEIGIQSPTHNSIFISKIKTWFTKESVEYLEFYGGVFVRLDKISSLDGKKMLDNSCNL